MTGRAVLCLLICAAAVHDGAGAVAQDGAPLDRRHVEFLDAVDPILGETERRVFGELRHAYQRDAFVQRFWAIRDPWPETRQNEFRERFEAAVRTAEERFGGARAARFRALLRHGEPRRTFRTTCELLRQLEVWHYAHSLAVRDEFYLIFLRRGGSWQPWTASDGISALIAFTAASPDLDEQLTQIGRACSSGGDLLAALGLALDWEAMEAKAPLSGAAGGEWALAFLDRSTQMPADAEALPAQVALSYPGRRGGRTVVQAIVGIDSRLLPDSDGSPRRFVVDGEVLRRGELFETFRYRFEHQVRPNESDGDVPLVLQRYLRPGRYRLAAKVRELETNRYFGVESDLDVPLVTADNDQPGVVEGQTDASALRPPGAAAAGAGSSTGIDVIPDWLAEVNRAATGEIAAEAEHSVRILPLPERLITGRVRVGANARGPGIHRLSFVLDGRELISKRRPPYEVEIDVGSAPRSRDLRVDALDENGAVLAADEVGINAGPHRFTIRLTSPQRGGDHVRSVRAAAEVEAPRHERLDRVEFFLNDTRTATLYQPPFEQPIEIDPSEPLSYVRAVAWLETGAFAEDVVFVNSPDHVDEVRVALIELYTSVTDRSGAPIRGLEETDFDLLVDGRRQPLNRLDHAASLPIHACILFDTSLSMEARLEAAEEAALHFFELVLGPHDRACLFTFNDRPELVVGFTGSPERLAGGLADLVAEGGTALYESVLHALYHFGGIRGKRALILLTDGGDRAAPRRFEEVVEYARRSEVAVYSIGIDIDPRELHFRSRLQSLCSTTGGRCFFISGASELAKVYESIESEVRSQYLLVFESPPSEEEAFHEVKVRLRNGAGRGRRGVKIQHAPGYFQ